MSIEEIAEERRVLADEIARMIQSFEVRTGARVSGIDRVIVSSVVTEDGRTVGTVIRYDVHAEVP